MRPVVACYRGIAIYQSRTILCLHEQTRPKQLLYEATVKDWLVIGSIDNICRHIDSMIGSQESTLGDESPAAPPDAP